MTSVKLKFHLSSSNHEGELIYQIIHRRMVRQIKSGYRIFSKEWNSHINSLNINIYSERKAYLCLINDKVHWEMRKLESFIMKLEHNQLEYTTNDIIAEFERSPHIESVFSFFQLQIDKLKTEQRPRCVESYRSTLNGFSAFLNGQDICFESIDSNLIEKYEAYLRARGLVRNTTSFYMRILRTVYNRAVECGYTVDNHPFRHVYKGVDKTVKRALPISYIRKIRDLDLSDKHALDFARDIFLFSFYARGMSFVDIAYLRKDDLQNGYISYCRRKTGQRLTIRWEKQMDDIAKKYEKSTVNFMFPIIRHENKNMRNQYKKSRDLVNVHLKEIAVKAGIHIPLSFYAARHSWASIAKEKYIPISVISEGMGHDSETTTQIYLKSLDTNVVDRANRKILDNP